MLSATELPRGIDPYAFNRKLSGIAAKHGIIYLDVFNDFKLAPHPEALFYPADGHLDPQGHVLVGRAIARSLMETHIPVCQLWLSVIGVVTAPQRRHFPMIMHFAADGPRYWHGAYRWPGPNHSRSPALKRP